VSSFARPLSSLANLHAVTSRARTLVAALLASSAVLLAFGAAQAAAIVTTVSGMTVGVQPRINEPYLAGAAPKTYANPSGSPVLHGTGVYAIYWDPDDEYWSEWQNSIDEYFARAGADSGSLASVFAVDAQYTDKSNRPASYSQTFKGAYTYTHAYPSSGCTDPEPFAPEDQIPAEFGGKPTAVCLTSAQVAAALEAAIAQSNLPRGVGNVYYMLTPPGVTVCLDGGTIKGHCSDYEGSSEESYEHSFCSYHSALNPGGLATGDANTIVYAMVPWTAGGLGDNHLLAANDRRAGWECQDGGIVPGEKGGGYEVQKIPDEQEPNQQPCPSTAGSCDFGLSDLIINQLSLQQENMVTDPLLNAWQDEHHYENSDECRFLFGPKLSGASSPSEIGAGTLSNQAIDGGAYFLNDAFDLAALRLPYPGVPCINAVNLDPKFTAPNTVNAGEVVGFDGMQSDIALDAAIGYSAAGAPQPNYATYKWNFGDGTPEVSGFAPGAPQCEAPWLSPCAASEFHTYQYGGSYEVTLTVTDVGGNKASVTHAVDVVGPPRPASSGGAGGPGSSSGGSTSGAGSSGSAAGVPAPVAAATVMSQSLRKVLRKGLLVRYSVNEQVAGRFEVLISSSLAHRLRISGTPATGLPVGSPAELVIAKAVLVTTAGGRSALHIQFSKRTDARLAHVHKVSLMLQLVVRNASSSSPATTTVLSSFTLTH